MPYKEEGQIIESDVVEPQDSDLAVVVRKYLNQQFQGGWSLFDFFLSFFLSSSFQWTHENTHPDIYLPTAASLYHNTEFWRFVFIFLSRSRKSKEDCIRAQIKEHHNSCEADGLFCFSLWRVFFFNYFVCGQICAVEMNHRMSALPGKERFKKNKNKKLDHTHGGYS